MVKNVGIIRNLIPSLLMLTASCEGNFRFDYLVIRGYDNESELDLRLKNLIEDYRLKYKTEVLFLNESDQTLLKKIVRILKCIKIYNLPRTRFHLGSFTNTLEFVFALLSFRNFFTYDDGLQNYLSKIEDLEKQYSKIPFVRMDYIVKNSSKHFAVCSQPNVFPQKSIELKYVNWVEFYDKVDDKFLCLEGDIYLGSVWHEEQDQLELQAFIKTNITKDDIYIAHPRVRDDEVLRANRCEVTSFVESFILKKADVNLARFKVYHCNSTTSHILVDYDIEFINIFNEIGER